MNQRNPARPGAVPFYLDTPLGKRFCLYHAPAGGDECAGAILYVHPFGDEMNASRRMAALQARSFSAMGFAVLQLDLLGCGDSSGELADATWHVWKQDVVAAAGWLREHASQRLTLWGLRLGATLALDVARGTTMPVARCIAWQPIIAGRPYLTQFLRMGAASEMLRGDTATNSGAHALRQSLLQGDTVEVGGYQITPRFAAGVDNVNLSDLSCTSSCIHWFELTVHPHAAIPATRLATVDAWKATNVRVQTHTVCGSPFWATREITECSALIEATANALTEVHDEV